jgi:predicted pyridoxine 5'-phosphate oxidase superfamily flavin-nucleotide-binding protein
MQREGKTTMSKIYSDAHRELQTRFDSRRMADLMEEGLVHAELSDDEQAFIGSRDMFFLSTIDGHGRPTVSYKGGAPGFVRIADPSTLLFPCYDGNGMFYSMGNIGMNGKVGMLFIDFETPHRLRVQGAASLRHDAPEIADYPEAQFIVAVKIEEIWVNCPRYIHRYQRTDTSAYVPAADRETPIPAWKRIDFVQDALPEKDQGRAETAGSLLSLEEYEDLVKRGEA